MTAEDAAEPRAAGALLGRERGPITDSATLDRVARIIATRAPRSTKRRRRKAAA